MKLDSWENLLSAKQQGFHGQGHGTPGQYISSLHLIWSDTDLMTDYTKIGLHIGY